MTRFSQIVMAALFAAFVGVVGLAPAKAAGIPAGSITGVEEASRATETVRHRRRVYRPVRVYRRHYYRPARIYRPYPVYRRCWTRPRLIWTPYGYVRRWVRVCR